MNNNSLDDTSSSNSILEDKNRFEEANNASMKVYTIYRPETQQPPSSRFPGVPQITLDQYVRILRKNYLLQKPFGETSINYGIIISSHRPATAKSIVPEQAEQTTPIETTPTTTGQHHWW